MKKAILLILLLSLGCSWADEPLRATVEKTWTIDTAREEAFREAKPWVDVSMYPSIDPNLIENRIAVQRGGGSINGRTISVFPGGDYSVIEQDSVLMLYYDASGALFAVEFYDSTSYPSKSYQYSASWDYYHIKKGGLVITAVHLRSNDDFVFYPDGSLQSHWKGDRCYKPDGSSCGTRKSYYLPPTKGRE